MYVCICTYTYVCTRGLEVKQERSTARTVGFAERDSTTASDALPAENLETSGAGDFGTEGQIVYEPPGKPVACNYGPPFQ